MMRYVVLLLVLFAALLSADVSAEQIEIHARALGQSREIPSAHLGLWNSGQTADADRQFFAEVDKQQQVWLGHRRRLLDLRAEESRRLSSTKKEEEAKKNKRSSAVPSAQVFSDTKLMQRIVSRERVMLNVDIDAREKLTLLLKEMEMILNERLEPFLLPRPIPVEEDEGSDERIASDDLAAHDMYNFLTTTVFNHTTATSSTETNYVQGWLEPFMHLLPRQVVLDGQVITGAKRELGDLRLSLKLLLHREGANITAPLRAIADDVNRRADAIHAILQASTTTNKKVLALTMPIVGLAVSATAQELQRIQRSLLSNDESTEALRREMKTMLRHRTRVQAWDTTLTSAHKKMMAAHDRQEHLSPDAFVISLLLLAKYRLGSATRASPLDYFPDSDTASLLTGTDRAELMRIIGRPFILNVLVSIMATYVLLWANASIARQLIIAKRNTVDGEAATTPSKSPVLRLCATLTFCCPLIIPTMMVVVVNIQRWEELQAWIACIRPVQRLLVVGLMMMLSVLNVLLCATFARNYTRRRVRKRLGSAKEKAE